MAARPYTAKVSVCGKEFACIIPLSDDDCAEFYNGEFNATSYVLDFLRQNATLQGYEFDERHVTLYR